jgi:hypothetical protein
MALSNVERVHRYHAALNALDLEAVEAMFAADGEYHSPSIGALIGRPAVMAAMRSYFAEYPDQHAIDDVVEALDAARVRSQWRLTATEKTTGKAYVRSGAEVITFNPDGLIVRVEVEDA